MWGVWLTTGNVPRIGDAHGGVTPCGENPHPLNDFTLEKVEEVRDKRPVIGAFPPLRQYWAETYWKMVQGVGRSRTRPAGL